MQSKLRLEAENAVLRHQLMVLRRRLHGRVRLTNHDRWFFIQLYRSILKVLTIIRPQTLVRWHRAGFRCYWRWKSRPLIYERATADRLPLSKTLSGWKLMENRAMMLCAEGSLQAYWLDGCRSISVAGSARGRDLDIAAANKCSEA